MKLLVDDRESLNTLNQLHEFSPIVTRLQLGDFQFGETPQLILEHKTLPDYIASMRDGRLYSQIEAMQESGLNFMLIITHGDISPDDKKIFRTSIANRQIFDKVRVILSDNLAEDIRTIIHCLESGPSHHDPVIKKKKILGQRECFIAQLACIPGIATKTATKLADKYGTIAALIRACETGDPKIIRIRTWILGEISGNKIET